MFGYRGSYMSAYVLLNSFIGKKRLKRGIAEHIVAFSQQVR